MSLDKKELLDRYEATGDEALFREALPLYEQAIANGATPDELVQYGYLLECHGRIVLRKAVAQYERAVELEPEFDKARYQLIGARAGLLEPEREIAACEKGLADAPNDIRQHRFLASAYLAGRVYDKARDVAERGLALAPDDAMLMGCRAEARAGLGDADGGLDDYRRALALDPEHIGPLYMSAFLLEREGRIRQAIDTWRSILEWNESRGYELNTIWPRQELARLTALAPEA
jgi:tetratricopeptide (TPR) repeat protein